MAPTWSEEEDTYEAFDHIGCLGTRLCVHPRKRYCLCSGHIQNPVQIQSRRQILSSRQLLDEEGKITLRREGGDEEASIPIIERFDEPDRPIEEPQLIFDMVGNFEPSYTEYVTEYVLAEVWLTEKEGFLVSSVERAEYNKTVEGVKAEK